MHTQQTTLEYLDHHDEKLSYLTREIWAHPEIALEERFACGLLANELEAAGFTVERGIGQLGRVVVEHQAGDARLHAGHEEARRAHGADGAAHRGAHPVHARQLQVIAQRFCQPGVEAQLVLVVGRRAPLGRT